MSNVEIPLHLQSDFRLYKQMQELARIISLHNSDLSSYEALDIAIKINNGRKIRSAITNPPL